MQRPSLPQRLARSTLPLLLFSAAVLADDLASLAEARAVADAAVALFQAEKFAEGYEGLKAYWPVPPAEIDDLAEQTVTQWPVVRQRFGAPVGIELVRDTRIGQSFVQYIYLQKFDNHAIRWLFVFYQPHDHWLVNNVSFDDNIELLFEPQ